MTIKTNDMSKIISTSPSLPLVLPINDKTDVNSGDLIIVKAVPHLHDDYVERFAINFTTGDRVEGDSIDDIILHFNVRMESSRKEIVLNTLINNTWGHEKRMPNYLQFGEPFEVRFLVTADKFNIALNGKHFCDYAHRVPVKNIRFVHIYGCLNVDVVEIVLEADKVLTPDSHPTKDGQMMSPFIYSPHIKPAVPHTILLPRGLHPPHQILISATVKKAPRRFAINFGCGENDIAFHLNPRWDTKPPELVRNTLRNGNWEVEERSMSLPFAIGGTFDMKIVCDLDQFLVFVNSDLLFAYKHRIHPQLIDRILIDGDLHLLRVHV